MLVSIALLLAAPKVIPAPVLPPGISAELQNSFHSVEVALTKRDFATAAKRAALLPKLQLAIEWDERKLPAARRAEFRAARDAAVLEWRKLVPGLTVTYRPKADIRFAFEPVLAEQGGMPAGIVNFFGDGVTQPRLESIIGIRRGSPSVPTEPADIASDVAYSLGSYFGLARGGLTTSLMGRTDMTMGKVARTSAGERATVAAVMRAAAALRKAIQEKAAVSIAAQPLSFIDPVSFRGDATQGDDVAVTIQLTNRGNSPLAFRTEVDCGCIVATDPGLVPPGTSRLIEASVQTREFSGEINRKIVLYTNDARNPIQIIPIRLNLKPKYQFIVPGGTNLVVPDGGGEFDVFLALPEDNPLRVTAAQFQGVDGSVTYEPWSGTLADPANGEPARERRGYRLKVKIPDNLVPGRNTLSLTLRTDSKEFSHIVLPLTAQKGIIAMPDELFLGEIGKAPKTVRISVSRPNGPFRVTAVTVDSPHFRVSRVAEGSTDVDHRIQLEYLGTASAGDLSATITVKTNDPKQSEILVPILATVR